MDTLRAQVQHIGASGSTDSCLTALACFLETMETCRPDVERVGVLVTHPHRHLFVLRDWNESFTIVRSGFTSGYSGEGPSGLSLALRLLRTWGYFISEIVVSRGLFGRLDSSSATYAEINSLSTKPRRPCGDYIIDEGWRSDTKEKLLKELGRSYRVETTWMHPDVSRVVVPALNKSVTTALREGYILLEERMRQVSGYRKPGVTATSVAAQVFGAKSPLLRYSFDSGEQEALMHLFMGAFGLFRNPTAHQLSPDMSVEHQARGIHLLDFLYRVMLSCDITDRSNECLGAGAPSWTEPT